MSGSSRRASRMRSSACSRSASRSASAARRRAARARSIARRQPFGKVVLVLLSAGFAAYALVAFRAGGQDDEWASASATRRAAIYVALAYSAARILAGAGAAVAEREGAQDDGRRPLVAGRARGSSGRRRARRDRRRPLEPLPRHLEEVRGQVGAGAHCEKWGGRVGVVGHVARFVVFVLIGVFAIKAAVDYNPKDAVGLDGALQKLAHAVATARSCSASRRPGSSPTPSSASSTRVTATSR